MAKLNDNIQYQNIVFWNKNASLIYQDSSKL